MGAEHDARVETFRRLHADGILVLPNAWDAASARLFEEAGARAIATSSSGVANALGYPDGDAVPRELVLQALARITRVVGVPVSADVEGGYGATPDEVVETVRGVVAAGAVGINLEDGRGEPEVLVAKIRAIRAFAKGDGRDVFVNARTDVYLSRGTPPAEALRESLRRAKLYVEAGADGIFIPALLDAGDLARFCDQVPRPVNALVYPGLPAPGELARLGVRRLSVGSGLMRAAYSAARRGAAELLESGSYAGFTKGVMSHAEANALFRAH